MQNKEIAELIKSTGGKFFTVDFTKKDGTERHMIARTGVKKHVTGVGLAFEPKDHGLVGVWDTVKKNYRFITLDTVKRFKFGNVEWGR